MKKERIEELRGLLEKAMAVPWNADIDDPHTPHEMWTGKFYGKDDTWEPYQNKYAGEVPPEDDAIHCHHARLVAAAVTALPECLDEIKRLQGIIKDMADEEPDIEKWEDIKWGDTWMLVKRP